MAGQRGNPNWIKGGASPNPGGRPKAATELRQRLEALALEDDACEGLRELMQSQDERIKLDTIKFIIEHVKGKPSQEITGLDGGAIEISAVDDRQRLHELRARYPELMALPGHDDHQDA
jgi:hypothetical protein